MPREIVSSSKAALVALLILLIPATGELARAENMTGIVEIVFLDVGQGDAMLLKTGDGFAGLIDSGRDAQVVNLLSEQQVEELAFIVITHWDADHAGGVLQLLEYYQPQTVLIASLPEQDDLTGQQIMRQLRTLQIETYLLTSDHDFRIGCCLTADTLWPDSRSSTRDLTDNDASVALRLSYKNFSIFSAGDLSSRFEEAASGLAPFSILKVSHHGSRTSTSAKLISQVAPQAAIISVGENNSYGHPHIEVVRNLEGIPTFRTDYLGTLTVKTDGEKMTICSEKGLECAQYSL